jgi:ornithine cyclodeaminase/alanine dehydrogenase-like protein (mu-crystallin family)
MLLVGASEVRAVLDTNVLRRALASGYAALSEGRADVPTRIMAHTATGLLGAMPGYVEGIGLAAKLVSVFPGNSEHDLPTHMAVVVLFDETTGMPLALIDGEVITEMRTSASAALACELLAPAEAEVLTIVGAGVQAAGHLTAFRSVRPWTAIRVANRTRSGRDVSPNGSETSPPSTTSTRRSPGRTWSRVRRTHPLPSSTRPPSRAVTSRRWESTTSSPTASCEGRWWPFRPEPV